MSMPMDLVFVHHGQSEANVVQRAEKAFERGEIPERHPLTEEVYARYDYQQRLSPQGIVEAEAAGQWLRDNFIEPSEFDERYVSPFNRTLETAAHLGGAACLWLPETNLIERDWGLYGATPKEERGQLFPHTDKAKEEASFFTRLENGESMFDAVGRVGSFIDTLDREKSDQRVLAVTHGELEWAIRFKIERMLPQEWQEHDKDKSLAMLNGNVMWYSRSNPEDSTDVSKSLSGGWLRIVNPLKPEKSPYGGEWQKLVGKRRFGPKQLGEIVSQNPRLLS